DEHHGGVPGHALSRALGAAPAGGRRAARHHRQTGAAAPACRGHGQRPRGGRRVTGRASQRAGRARRRADAPGPAPGGAVPAPARSSMTDTVLIIDFGSQVTQLIARRVREAGAYSHIVPFNRAEEALARFTPKAVILSGGPASVTEFGTPRAPDWVFAAGLPVLGICY